jgi:hypothetical protein
MATISQIPLWGRAWSLTVQYASGGQTGTKEILSQQSWEPEALRMTFEVLESTLPSPFWFADISVYNLNDPEAQNAILNATWVTFQAGYQTGPTISSIIWDGPVLQVLFDREDVVNTKVTFHCVASIPLINDNIVNFAQGPFSSQAQLVARMVSTIGGTFAVQQSAKASQLLASKQYPRGKTVFGKVSKYLFEMGSDNFLSQWMDGKQAYLSEMDSGAAPPANVLTYSPAPPPGFNPSGLKSTVTQSVLSVPRQTPFGVIFTVLLDPRLKVQIPPMLVQLDRTIIAQMKVQYGQIQTPLDQNLTFVAAQIRHRGDTRGTDWQTEITGYSRTYAQGLLNGMFTPNSAGVTQ